MDPISAPPTRNDVVRETMKRSMNVAAETQQQCGIVTYDLAVVLKAYSIQALDAPVFDNLLILLGNFNLELAFIGAVGTFINESGAEYLLTEQMHSTFYRLAFCRSNVETKPTHQGEN